MKVPLQLVFMALALVGFRAAAQTTVTWSGASGDWAVGGNWSPNQVPQSGDTVSFTDQGISNVAVSGSANVGAIMFNPAAPAYTITTPAEQALTIAGTAVGNQSANTQNFVIAGAVTEAGQQGRVRIDGGTVVGSVQFTSQRGAATGAYGGDLILQGTANGGAATYVAEGGILGHGGFVSFGGNSSAATATITLHGGAAGSATGGNALFVDNSSAGTSTISVGNGSVAASLLFSGNGSAGAATATVLGGSSSGDDGGLVMFQGSAKAETATFHIQGGSNGGSGGKVQFSSAATADQGTFLNEGATDSGTGGSTTFADTSGAGNAKLIANAGTSGGAGGMIIFQEASDGQTASVTLNGNGSLDISGHDTGVTIGSLQGTGNAVLGAKTLTVGSDNTSTTFSGVILDGPATGGSLAKTGTGTLTLSGANTYTGGTTVSAGTLAVASPSALGSAAAGTILNGGLLRLDNVSIGAEPLTLDGSGFGSDAVSLAATGSSSFSGAIALVKAATISTPGETDTLSLTGSVSGTTLRKIGLGQLRLDGASLSLPDLYIFEGSLRMNGVTGTVPIISAAGIRGSAVTIEDAAPSTLVPGATFALYNAALKVHFNESIGSLGDHTHNAQYIPGSVIIDSGAKLTLTDYNTYSGNIAGPGTLEIASGANQSLAGSVANDVGVSIKAGGTLTIGARTRTGSVAAPIANEGSLVFNRADPLPLAADNGAVGAYYDHASVISGTGSVTVANGQMSISSANTYTGNTTITPGTRLIANNPEGTSATGTGEVFVQANAMLEIGRNTTGGNVTGAVHLLDRSSAIFFVRTNDSTFTAPITGSGYASKGGTGTLTLNPAASGDNTFTGFFMADNGTLADGKANAFSANARMLVSSTGTVQVNYAETIAGLEDNGGTGAVKLAAGTTLTISTPEEAFSWFSGTLTGDTSTTLTKSGIGAQGFSGNSTDFAGDVYLEQGTLLVSGTTKMLGTGTLHLVAGTLAAEKIDSEIANAVQIHSGATVVAGKGNSATLTVKGAVSLFDSDGTRLHVRGERPVIFEGALSGYEGPATLTVDGGTPLVLAGATSTGTDKVSSITADQGAILFANENALPAGLTVAATNSGYVGVVTTSLPVTAPTPARLLSRIIDKSNFSGTFGLDSESTETPVPTFSDALNFSGFDGNANFKLGSMTAAIVNGAITPPVVAGAPRYTFGGGVGALVIDSTLDNAGSTASVLVTSPSASAAQTVIFRGASSYTGTTTLGGVTANLVVDRSIAILDDDGVAPATPLPGTFGMSTNGPAYVGYTEKAGFSDFASFRARLAPSGANVFSILGFDSHDFIAQKLSDGTESTPTSPARVIDSKIDLGSLDSVYLGTATAAVLRGPIVPPTDHTVRLTAANDGRLTLASGLTSAVSALVIGTADLAGRDFGDGTVEIAAPWNGTGSVTLHSGTLLLNAPRPRPGINGSVPLLGTGTLYVESGATEATIGSVAKAAIVSNPIVLNAPLHVGATISGAEDHRSLELMGQISGAEPLHLYGAIGLKNYSNNNSYSGGTTLHSATVQAAGDKAFGTGAVSVQGDKNMLSVSSGSATTFDNPFVIDGSLMLAAGGGLTLAGPITLTDQAKIGVAWARGIPVQFTGVISGKGPLNLESQGTGDVLWVGGASANTYQGGTLVSRGLLVFSSLDAIPATGLIKVEPGAYVGAAVTNQADVNRYLKRFDTTGVQGSIGFDRADPSATTPLAVAADVNLTGFLSAARLASATAAEISGLITPAGVDYWFGNGGGTLTVSSSLSGNRGLNLSSNMNALTLVLKGANTYTGATYVQNSVLRFDTAGALSSSTSLQATGGYIGYADSTIAAPAFIGKIDTGNFKSKSIVGFDSADKAHPREISAAISLASFPVSTFLGTSTAAILTGSLTPPSDRVLSLMALNQGSLVVDTALTSAAVDRVVLGRGDSLLAGTGTITLKRANTYTGGTTLASGAVALGTSTSLGTGTLTVEYGGVMADTTDLTITNPIAFSSPTSTLMVAGARNLTFAGNITSSGWLFKQDSGTLTIAGATGANTVNYTTQGGGALTFSTDSSFGLGSLTMYGGTVRFLGSSPTIYTLQSPDPTARVVLMDSAALTINSRLTDYDSPMQFAGSITGDESAPVSASVALNNASGTGVAYMRLAGNSTYSGTTYVNNRTLVEVASTNALGTGPVQVNGGRLAVATGTMFTFNSSRTLSLVNGGQLGGSGLLRFDTNTLHIAANTLLVPGITVPGQLRFEFTNGAKLSFDSDGTYTWRMGDALNASTGWASVQITTGTLDITATSSLPFNLKIETVNASGDTGWASNFDPNGSYNWTLVTAGAITGFDASKFNLDTSGFENAFLPGAFTIGVNNLSSPTSLILSYNATAVPEPSTWALLLGGLVAVALVVRRRRTR